MLNIIRYILIDNLKNRFMVGYLFFLIAASFGLFILSNDADKGVLGMSNIVLLMVPLVCSIYTGISVYNAADFTRLLLTQPVSRVQIFLGYFISITVALITVFIVGVGIALVTFSSGERVFTMLVTGIMLSVVFSAIAFLVSLSIQDKVKGVGVILFLWLYFAVMYDGVMLMFVKAMSDYPIEQYSIILALLNPVDLCRMLIMFSLDISVLMGLTGAVIQDFLGTTAGKWIIYFTLMIWAVIPVLWSSWLFRKKDF